MKTWENVLFCPISFITFLYVFHSMYGVNEVMNCFILKHGCGDFMSPNILDMSHMGFDIKLSIFTCAFKSVQSAIHSIYIITILPSILFISRRVVAGAVSKGGSL